MKILVLYCLIFFCILQSSCYASITESVEDKLMSSRLVPNRQKVYKRFFNQRCPACPTCRSCSYCPVNSCAPCSCPDCSIQMCEPCPICPISVPCPQREHTCGHAYLHRNGGMTPVEGIPVAPQNYE